MIVTAEALVWVMRTPMPGVFTVILVNGETVNTCGVYTGGTTWQMRRYEPLAAAHQRAVRETELAEEAGAKLALKPQTILLSQEERRDLAGGRRSGGPAINQLALRMVELAKSR